MIDKITLKSGSCVGKPNLEVDLTPVTIFVGPNNSGKSKVLQEIESNCYSSKSYQNNLVLDHIVFSSLTKEEIEYEISLIEIPIQDVSILGSGFIRLSKIHAINNLVRHNISRNNLIHNAQNPNSTQNDDSYLKFLQMYVLGLRGDNRLNLLREAETSDLQNFPQNLLTYLFKNNELRAKIRQKIYDAFGKYFVIDLTNVRSLRVRLSDVPPVDEEEERGWTEKSILFHSNAKLIDDMSDGIKAFCGIITSIMAGDSKITLIDEPEAFLHPSLASRLGKEICKTLVGTKKRFFASTHSASFLMGCIQSGTPLNIVRLTYKNGLATSRLLPQDKILHLMRHPLLRSTGVLNGVFYESVIVTEADSDRAFYQEINERLLSENDSRGINNCLFINAQNKQTVWSIVAPLRELGIPTVGVVDIDVLKEGGRTFGKLLDGAFIPELSHKGLESQRKSFYDALNATERNWKIDGGIQILNTNEQEACNSFFDQLENYGVFVVRNGELESWMKYINPTRDKSNWLIDVFEKMGENPEQSNYVKPSNGDVWDFIGSIKKWLDNNNRKGIPE
ncbi:hypothetical protein AD998_06705 [bacterium 336/3]|nr:hypothetical protein AD998_06705 [bacterium 336/3]